MVSVLLAAVRSVRKNLFASCGSWHYLVTGVGASTVRLFVCRILFFSALYAGGGSRIGGQILLYGRYLCVWRCDSP